MTTPVVQRIEKAIEHLCHCIRDNKEGGIQFEGCIEECCGEDNLRMFVPFPHLTKEDDQDHVRSYKVVYEPDEDGFVCEGYLTCMVTFISADGVEYPWSLSTDIMEVRCLLAANAASLLPWKLV